MDLDAAYRACRRMQRRHDPTYYWATRRLPRELQPAVHALYGYVRGADEIVDGPRRPSTATERRAALDVWEEALREGLADGRSDHPVIAALVDAAAHHELPLEEELAIYMGGSAGSVGRIMASLLGAPRQRDEDFVRLGAAFQLTNFIRDVREDYGLDRVYLPRADRERFDVAEAELGRPVAGPGVRALLAEEVARARRLFADSAAAVDDASPRVRSGMRLARGVYLRVLDRVEAIGFDVLGRRTGLAPWEVGPAALRSLVTR
jgi:phytoene synthase